VGKPGYHYSIQQVLTGLTKSFIRGREEDEGQLDEYLTASVDRLPVVCDSTWQEPVTNEGKQRGKSGEVRWSSAIYKRKIWREAEEGKKGSGYRNDLSFRSLSFWIVRGRMSRTSRGNRKEVKNYLGSDRQWGLKSRRRTSRKERGEQFH